jgi:jumonji domain-containing protein 2
VSSFFIFYSIHYHQIRLTIFFKNVKCKWAKGSKLGDTIIPSPIKQTLAGIGGVYEYTFLEQPPISVAQFRIQADEYRKRHIGKEFDEDHTDELCDELARKFWKRLGPTMEPSFYGADMEGTLFNDAHACGWNVDRLESCLCLLRADATEGDSDDKIFHLPGVTSAYLYFGCWASAFAAHNEDMNLLSINYLHAGSPKYWYAVAHEDSKRFESLASSHFLGPASECREFLRHKRCLLSPAILRKAGIKFTTCIQRPGDASESFTIVFFVLHEYHPD